MRLALWPCCSGLCRAIQRVRNHADLCVSKVINVGGKGNRAGLMEGRGAKKAVDAWIEGVDYLSC